MLLLRMELALNEPLLLGVSFRPLVEHQNVVNCPLPVENIEFEVRI